MVINKKSIAYAVLSVLSIGSFSAQAQEPMRGQRVTERPWNAYTPIGINLGGFTFSPKFVSENVYNDNIYYNNAIKTGDFIFHLQPSVALNSNWNRHAFGISVGADVAYYASHSSEDWQDYFLNLSGRYDVLKDSFASAKFYHKKQHENRGSPDGTGGIEPVTYYKLGGDVGYEHMFNRVRLNVANETYHLSFDDGTSILNGATIPNQLRDRLKNESTVRVGYEFLNNYEAFLRGSYNFIDYDNKFDRFGLERSSIGYEIVTGISLDFTGKLIGDAYIGYINQDYDDANLDTISDVTGGFSLTWMPTGLTTVRGAFDRKPQETTQGYASSSLNSKLRLDVDHELLRNVLLNANFGYQNNEYEGSSSAVGATPARDDNIYSTGISAKYLFNRNFYVKGEYKFEARRSNINFGDYDINRVYLSVGAQI